MTMGTPYVHVRWLDRVAELKTVCGAAELKDKRNARSELSVYMVRSGNGWRKEVRKIAMGERSIARLGTEKLIVAFNRSIQLFLDTYYRRQSTLYTGR
jgi:predicted secreted protein